MYRALAGVVATRLLAAIPTLVALSALVFVVLRVIPSDPLATLLPPNATAEDAARLRAALGLDRSIPAQFAIWLADAVRGDLGVSIAFREPVANLIANTLPATIELAAVGVALALAIGIPGGLVSYAVRGGLAEGVADALVIVLLSIPSFLWAIFLLLGLGVALGLLPFSGRTEGVGGVPDGTGFLLLDFVLAGMWGPWLDALRHLVLPGLALALGFSPFVIRVLKSSLIEEGEAAYVATARQRGLSDNRVLVAHMLKNAALPTITLIGAQFGFLFGGTLLVETIFSFPGMGNLMVQAVRNHDLPIIQAVALVFCVLVQAINLVVDVLYIVLNPRLRTAAA